MTKMRIRATVFQAGLTAWLTLVAMTGAATAGPIEDGSAAYQRHDYETALRLLRTPAEQGSAEAQLLLGFMYHDGEGVPQDYAEAARWLRKAAEQGNIAAQGALGGMYLDGLGVPKDPAQATRWLQKAAEQGLPPAQSVLGSLADQGGKYVDALKWYRLAADQGHPRALALLGYLSEQGKGLPLDYVSAYAWYSRAIAAGEESSSERLKNLSQIMTRKQLDQANSLLSAQSVSPQHTSAPSDPTVLSLLPTP